LTDTIRALPQSDVVPTAALNKNARRAYKIKEVEAEMRRKISYLKGWPLLVSVLLLTSEGPAPEPGLPDWAIPRSTSFEKGLDPQYLMRAREKQARYLRALLSLAPEDQYLMGLANTLEMLLGFYGIEQGRLPASVEEFLASPYNLLAESAWTNPYSGHRIQWSVEPSRGDLYLSLPESRYAPILVVPWVPRLPDLTLYEEKKVPPGQTLGVWGLFPWNGGGGLATSPGEAARWACDSVGTAQTPCQERRYLLEVKKYTPAEYQTYLAAGVVTKIFHQIFLRFEAGMPTSLDEVRSRYWWFFNSLLRNPFTGAVIEERSFLADSPGDFVFALYGRGYPHIYIDMIPIGTNRRFLHPYDEGGGRLDVTLAALVRYEYIRGAEGRSLCSVFLERFPEAANDARVQDSCDDPELNGVLLSAPFRR